MAIALRAVGTTSKVASGNMAPGLPAGHTTDDILILATSQQDNVACSIFPNTSGAVVRSVGAKTATATGGGTGPLTITAPTGIATGDLELLIGTTIAGATLSISSDGGGAWTSIGSQDVTGGDMLYAWYRIRAGGDGSPQLSTTSDHIVGCRIAIYSDSFDSSTPIEAAESSNETTSDTSFSYATANSTTVDNCLCFVLCSSGVDSNTGQAGTNTANSNLTAVTASGLMEHESTSGGGGGYWGATGFLATHGAIGTWSQTMVSASPKAYISFAIRPNTVAGWELEDSLNDGTSRRGEVWWKRDNGSESAPTVVHPAGGVSNATIAAYSGVDNGLSNPFRDVQNQTGTDHATVTAPALTGVVSGDMLIFYGLFTVNDTSGSTTNNWGTVSGFTEEKDDCSGLGGAWATSFGLDDLVASGSAGSITSAAGWTGGFTGWGWIGWQLALSSDTSSGPQTVVATGLDTAQQFGAGTIVPGGVAVGMTGLGSAQAFGTPKMNLAFSVSGLVSAQAFGRVSLAFQVPSLNGARAFGSPLGVGIQVPSLGSAGAFGTPSASTGGSGQNVGVSGKSSAQAFGTPVPAPGGVVVVVVGLGSAQGFGVTQENIRLTVAGKASSQAFGTITLAVGGVTVPVSGAPTSQAFGNPSVTTPGTSGFDPGVQQRQRRRRRR